MAGIFDFLGTDFESPKTQAILSLGLGLLSGKDPSFAGALGQAGQQALGVYGQARQGEETRKLRQQQQAMAEMQMEQLKRQQAMEQARQQALRDAVIPGMPAQMPASMDARDIGLPGEAPVQATPAGLDLQRYAMGLAQAGDPSAIGVLQSLQKEQPKPFTRKRDEDLLVPDGKGGVRVLMQGEADPTKGSPLGQLIAEMNALPPGDPRRAIYLQAITKATTHSPPVQVATYGQPVPVQLPGGGVGFAQPGNREGAAPILMTGPDGKPLLKPEAQPKPLSSTELRMQDEALAAISVTQGTQQDLATLKRQIESGALRLGPIANAISTLRNQTGRSNEQSQNFSAFRSTLEKLRNDSLRLNTGVQTDGDAQRAWNELFDSINDPGVVQRQLDRIMAINKRGEALQRARLDAIRENRGMPPVSGQPAAPATVLRFDAQGNMLKD